MSIEPELLAAFYNEITQEIRRLREEHWKLSYYFVAESLAVIYLFADDKVEKYLNLWVMIPVLVLQLGCMYMYSHHLHANHLYIAENRYVRRKLEALFGIHGLQLPNGETVLPDKWKQMKPDTGFEYDTVVLPLMTFVLAVQIGSIYLLARLLLRNV